MEGKENDMKNFTRRAASIFIAAAMITGIGTAATIPGLEFLPKFSTNADAANELGYINVSGEYKTRSSYSEITSSTTRLDGGWYAVTGNVTINSRVLVSDDTYIVLTDGSKLVVKGGIEVASGVKFNVYTQQNSTGSLYAGTTSGSNMTADTNKCGIGGKGAKINLVGGNIYAVGGYNAVGIQGSDIHVYWTNPSDSIYASSYYGTVSCYSYFIKTEKGTVCNKNTVISQGMVEGYTLKAALPITKNTLFLNDGSYVVADDVTVNDRMSISGTVNIHIASGKSLRAYDGITVPNGSTLRISGKGKLFAGTSNGSNTTADDNNAGIGSENGSRAGSIIIKEATVNAAGGKNAAGIGGNTASIEIDSGTVNATGGRYGAGIGSGFNDNGASIQILGGNVKAIGGSNAAGIGSGNSSGNSTIELGTTYSDDTIYASSYTGTVKFLKTLYTSDGQVANKNNIAGKELSPQITAYTVSFESSGGTYFSPVTVRANDYLTSLPTPNKVGSSFAGWYTDKSLRYQFDARYTRITGNLTLYAKWINATHMVTFSTGLGTKVNPITVEDGGYLMQFQDPTRKGYKFTGWYTDEYCQYPFNWNTRIYNDMTLYAGWTPIDEYFTVTFDAGAGEFYNGKKIESVKVNNGDSALRYAPSVPNYIDNNAEFAFDGWYYNNIVSGDPYYGDPIYADTKLVASYHWVRDIPATHTVTLMANGSVYDAFDIDDGSVLYQYSLPDATIAGTNYQFVGWCTDSSCTSLLTSLTITRDTYLYAKYEENTIYHTVTFNAGAGTFDDGTVKEFDVVHNQRTNYPPTPSYYPGGEEAIFEGWFYEDTGYRFNGEPITANTTLIAHYLDPYTNTRVASVFDGAGLIAIIAGGLVLAGGGVAAGIAIGKKKK